MTEAPVKLAGYFLEWQLIEDAKAELADRSKDLFKAMKDEGYDTKAARAVFREKRAELNAKPEDVAKAEEAEAIQDLYRAALDSGLTARAGRARETQETPAPERKTAGSAPRDMGSNGANAGGENVDGSTSRAGHTGQQGYVRTGPVESRNSEENFVERNTSGPDAKRAPHSQSAETPTADKPEAHAQALSDASGALSDEDVPAFLKREVA